MIKRCIAALLFITWMTAAAEAAGEKAVAPLLVGGNFSTQTSISANTKIFDQRARDAEVASLNEKLKNKQFEEVVKRINELTAKNFLDNRFPFLLRVQQ